MAGSVARSARPHTNPDNPLDRAIGCGPSLSRSGAAGETRAVAHRRVGAGRGANLSPARRHTAVDRTRRGEMSEPGYRADRWRTRRPLSIADRWSSHGVSPATDVEGLDRLESRSARRLRASGAAPARCVLRAVHDGSSGIGRELVRRRRPPRRLRSRRPPRGQVTDRHGRGRPGRRVSISPAGDDPSLRLGSPDRCKRGGIGTRRACGVLGDLGRVTQHASRLQHRHSQRGRLQQGEPVGCGTMGLRGPPRTAAAVDVVDGPDPRPRRSKRRAGSVRIGARRTRWVRRRRLGTRGNGGDNGERSRLGFSPRRGIACSRRVHRRGARSHPDTGSVRLHGRRDRTVGTRPFCAR